MTVFYIICLPLINKIVVRERTNFVNKARSTFFSPKNLKGYHTPMNTSYPWHGFWDWECDTAVFREGDPRLQERQTPPRCRRCCRALSRLALPDRVKNRVQDFHDVVCWKMWQNWPCFSGKQELKVRYNLTWPNLISTLVTSKLVILEFDSYHFEACHHSAAISVWHLKD